VTTYIGVILGVWTELFDSNNKIVRREPSIGSSSTDRPTTLFLSIPNQAEEGLQ
jgi:hypothetical protein